MLMAIFVVVEESNSANELLNAQSQQQFDPNLVMPETVYYKNYDDVKSLGNAVVIYPIFTQNAYDWGGIHDYYVGRCDTCLTTDIDTSYEKLFAASGNVFSVLEFLGYYIIDDIDLDKDPQIIEKFDKVILLHNEFVTDREFEAITNHPNVVYLFPNALSSKISVDYEENTMSLIRGPGYPESDITNGFDWEYDNSGDMQDWACNDWEFIKIDNGHMLNCYPETFLPSNGLEILQEIREL